MIPYSKLILSNRHAKVLNGSLPTEQHGDNKQAFFDVKIETLVELGEINTMLSRPPNEQSQKFNSEPARHIFDYQQEGHPLNMPDVDIVADLRKDIRGALVLKVGVEQMDFEDAHTVGAVNRLSFMTGGKGRLVLQFRIDPNQVQFSLLVNSLERGECELAFTESDQSATKVDENQEEMAV